MKGGITAALLNLLRSRRLIGKWRDIQRVTDAKQDLIESLMKAGVAPPPPSATTPQPQPEAKAPAADATTTDKTVASLSGAKSLMTRLATESLRFVANQEKFFDCGGEAGAVRAVSRDSALAGQFATAVDSATPALAIRPNAA